MSARTTSNAQGESCKNELAHFYWRGAAADAEGLIAVNKRKEGDKGQMTVAQFLEMTAEDRKVVR